MKTSRLLNMMLVDRGNPVVTDYGLFLILRTLLANGSYQGRRVRGKLKVPDRAKLHSVTQELLQERFLRPDSNFGRFSGVYRVSDVPDGSAEDIAALVDPFCYISHISAMQRYGLTNRLPEALVLSTPVAWAKHRNDKLHEDYGATPPGIDDYFASLIQHAWPDTLRRRPLSVHRTKREPEILQIKGSFARIATVGETFVQMLDRPELCGGMLHVVDVWDEHAETYLRDLIPAVDRSPEKIIKVRAGYLLEERLGIRNGTVESWSQFAQRGGSRRLDPSQPYVSKYSEKWMLSLNAEP